MEKNLRSALRLVRASGRSFELIAELIEESEDLELKVRRYLGWKGGKHNWWYYPEKMVTICTVCKKEVSDEELHFKSYDSDQQRVFVEQGVCPGR